MTGLDRIFNCGKCPYLLICCAPTVSPLLTLKKSKTGNASASRAHGRSTGIVVPLQATPEQSQVGQG